MEFRGIRGVVLFLAPDFTDSFGLVRQDQEGVSKTDVQNQYRQETQQQTRASGPLAFTERKEPGPQDEDRRGHPQSGNHCPCNAS